MPLFRLFIFILLIKAFAMLCYVQWGPIGLCPDEAQYWTWSKQLDWGYYSKPPGIAWVIHVGTLFFGDTELGVRVSAILIGFLIPFAVYHFAKCSGLDRKSACFAGILTALTPLGILSSLFATTDPSLVLFWTLGCAEIVLAIAKRSIPRYEFLGCIILLGALFKWPIYYLWLIVGLLFFIYPFFRSLTRISHKILDEDGQDVATDLPTMGREHCPSDKARPIGGEDGVTDYSDSPRVYEKYGLRVFLGIFISLFGLLPSFYWNAMHGWPTFKHVWYTLPFSGQPGGSVAASGNPIDFIGAQIALVSPVLFVFLLLSFYSAWRERKNVSRALHFCAILSIGIVTIHIFLSFFKKMQGNWCVYAYPPAFVVLGWFFAHKVLRKKVWLSIGLGTSLLLSLSILLIPLPYSIRPFRECIGWRNLFPALRVAGYESQKEFLFSDNYQMASLLSFYAPEQKNAYFFNLSGRRKNQFSYWPGMAEREQGKSGIFVVAVRTSDPKTIQVFEGRLVPYFLKVEYLDSYPLFGKEKVALLFHCEAYNGEAPEESHLY